MHSSIRVPRVNPAAPGIRLASWLAQRWPLALGWFGIFLRIYLPLSRPALISAGLILFVFQWQAFLWPLLIAPDPDYKVAAVAIADFAGEHSTDFGAMFAGSVFVSFVPLIILLVFQRYFTSSIAATGTHG